MVRILACILALIVLVGAIFAFVGFGSPTAREGRTEELSRASQHRDGVTRLLFLGCDRSANLTDSIMILSLENATGRLGALQIPRDTYAAYTERDYKKLNGAYSLMGLDGVKRFLSDAVGVPINYAVAVDLDSVASLVDAIGGVDLCIEQDMVYTDEAQSLNVVFQAGEQHLNGEQAERFLRFRSGYANADLGRMDAQKLFLQAFAKRCTEVSPNVLLQAMGRLFPRMQTDLPLPTAIGLINRFVRGEISEASIVTAPGEPVQGTSGAWYYSLNRAGMIRVINEYLFPTSPVSEATFDKSGIFDRADHPDFHRIYTSPDQASDVGILSFSEERKRYGRNAYSKATVS